MATGENWQRMPKFADWLDGLLGHIVCKVSILGSGIPVYRMTSRSPPVVIWLDLSPAVTDAAMAWSAP